VWRDTTVELPEGAPAAWRNVFTDEATSGKGKISMAKITERFPLGLLIGDATDIDAH
jgi:(1->4)-alpha-D-glucan 1-alpha-D-glucosylmutase